MLGMNRSHNQYTGATAPARCPAGATAPARLPKGSHLSSRLCTGVVSFCFLKSAHPPDGPKLTTAQAELPAAVLLGDGIRQQQHLILKAASLEGRQEEDNQWGLQSPGTSVNSNYGTPY